MHNTTLWRLPRATAPRVLFVALVVAASVLLGAIALAGYAGAANADEGATIPRYSLYPATTIHVKQGTPAQCRREADGFSRAAKGFLRPFPSDTDIYLVLGVRNFADGDRKTARQQFERFQALAPERHDEVAVWLDRTSQVSQ